MWWFVKVKKVIKGTLKVRFLKRHRKGLPVVNKKWEKMRESGCLPKIMLPHQWSCSYSQKKNLFHATLLDIIHRLLHSCCPPFSHVVSTLSYLHAGRIIQFQLCASHVLSLSLTYMSSSVTGSRFVLGPHFFLFLKGQFRQNVDIPPPPVFWHHISAMSLHISAMSLHISAMSHSISAISLHISAMNPSISTNEPPHISKVLLCNSW